jgi:hypothetical protein
MAIGLARYRRISGTRVLKPSWRQKSPAKSLSSSQASKSRSGFLARFAQKLSLTCQIFSKFQFPDSAEGGLLLCGVGQSEFELAMTHRVITLEFVVPTVVAIALGILLSMGAVYVTDRYLGPPDQPEAYRSVASGR